MPENLKVTFVRVHAKPGASDDHWDWVFTAKVAGEAVAGTAVVFDAVDNGHIDFPEDWKKEVDVAGKDSIELEFQALDQFDASDLGTVKVTLNKPWRQSKSQMAENANFIVEFSVELEVAGKYGQHPTDAIFACRASATGGGFDIATVSAATYLARLEFHEVVPVPPMVDNTDRPAFPTGAPPAVLNDTATPALKASDPINVIRNPPVIPILPASEACETTAAKLEFTYYRPRTLAFTDDDERLEWSVNALNGGSVAFLGPKRGTKVLVYGTAQGEVQFEVKFRGTVMARYRALVLPLKKIPCRANILNGPNSASKPKITEAQVVSHIAIANRFLRQLALELMPDRGGVTKWYANTGVAKVSANGAMLLVVGNNNHPFNVKDKNHLEGVRDAINALGSGVKASIESQTGGDGSTQHRLVLTYVEDPTIKLTGDPSDAARDLTGVTKKDQSTEEVEQSGALRLTVGACEHDFTLEKISKIRLIGYNNNLKGLRDKINSLKADVKASISEDDDAYRLVLEPQPPKNVELIDDPDGAYTSMATLPLSDGAVSTSVPGVFKIAVAAGLTKAVVSGYPDGAKLNFRPNMFNFAYVHSSSDPSVLGAATDRQSSIGASVSDSGTPSSSWKSPSGVPPHGGAGTVTMNVRPARRRNDPAPTPNPLVGLFSMWVATNGTGKDPTKDAVEYGNTIAHELGHVLHLGHRSQPGGAVDDGVNHPPAQNIMHPSNPASIAQDFDILQARAVRNSPLVTSW